MALRLDGRNPLAYLGVRPVSPPALTINTRRPTANDIKNFELGTFWVIPTSTTTPTNEVWVLVDKSSNVATWKEVSTSIGTVPGSQYTLLTADGSGGYGTNVGSGTVGQVLISGGALANPSFGSVPVSGGGTGLADVPAYNLLVGNGTAALNLIAPDATVGIPLVSQGVSANPSYGTTAVSGGGTGKASATAYAVQCGGTTSTGPHQSVAALGASGTVLTSTGAGSLPTFQPATGGLGAVNVQTFTTSGTYTPTAGMAYCNVEIVGGGGGAMSFTTLIHTALGGGAGGGSYCKKVFAAATIGASQVITIGTGGTGYIKPHSVPAVPGTNGLDSTFGSLLTAGGGKVLVFSGLNYPGLGGVAVGGDVNVDGEAAYVSLIIALPSSTYFHSGAGGSSFYGVGGAAVGGAATRSNGNNGRGYGGGGAGSGFPGPLPSAPPVYSGSGTAGICIITEYIS